MDLRGGADVIVGHVGQIIAQRRRKKLGHRITGKGYRKTSAHGLRLVQPAALCKTYQSGGGRFFAEKSGARAKSGTSGEVSA
jgi:hypothetical protein